MLKSQRRADVRSRAFHTEAAPGSGNHPPAAPAMPSPAPTAPAIGQQLAYLDSIDGAPHESKPETAYSNGEQPPPIQYPGPPSFAKAGFLFRRLSIKR